MPRLLSRLAPPLIALLLAFAAHAQTTYDVVPLPARLGDGIYGDAALNNRGSVIADSGEYPTSNGYLWKNGRVIPLPSLGGTFTVTHGLSELDHVVGLSCQQDNLSPHAALWRDGQVIEIEPPGSFDSGALRINRFDEVAVFSDGPSATSAYKWSNGSFTFLGDLGGSVTYPFGINDAGDVVGQAAISNVPDPRFHIPPNHGFLWHAGTMTDLGSIFGADFNGAFYIDNAGRIIGIADLAGDQAAHGFLWIGGRITDLRPLAPRDVVSWAFSMNKAGQIVGSSGLLREHIGPPYDFMRCPCHAVLWENAQPIDLNTRVAAKWNLDFATAINDKGEILAHTMKPFSAPVLLIPQQGNHPVVRTLRKTEPYIGPRQLRRDSSNRIAEVW